MQKPRITDYSIKALIAIGNQTSDELLREDIRNILVNRLRNTNYSVMYLLSKFSNSKDIMRYVYADLIMIMVCNHNLYLSSVIMDEIVKLVSMDVLTEYGMKSNYEDVMSKCKDEFWKRALDKEENVNLIKKKYK